MARVNGSVGTTRGFVAAVNKWTKETEERSEAAFRAGIMDFKNELINTTPIDTGNLRASLFVSTNKSGGVGSGTFLGANSTGTESRNNSVISGLKLGDRVTLVYRAVYARRLEMGFTGIDSIGRYYNQAGRWWIRAASARYVSIMRAAATRLRKS